LPEPVIEVEEVGKRFEAGGRTVTALRQLSMRVEAGQITGLVGPDGAGKTTLMRLMTGLLKPDSGRIRVFGLDSVSQSQEIQANIGYMPQRFGLYEDLSVIENLGLYADLQGLAGRERTARFERLMEFTGLGQFRKRLAGQLSGGMKQKLGLACTLVRPPRLLLLDEPSVGVDPVSRRELWEIVNALIDEGISILWSTAYLDEAEKCDDVVLLDEGSLLDSGPPEKFGEQLSGRTYEFSLNGADKRTLLRELAKGSIVIDASIKGRDVRLLLAHRPSSQETAELADLADIEPAELKEVEPGFEDAFVALIKAQQQSTREEGETAPDIAMEATPNAWPGATVDDGPVIQVEGLVRMFGDFRAVDGIDFQVSKGEIFGLLGPNGAGKSTTFKMLCGLMPPTDGKALVLGIDLRRAAAIARGRIGYMAQKFSLYGNMTVGQNLHFFASAYGLSGDDRAEAIRQALANFGLETYAEGDSGNLPLGYKQRLALAAAIMHRPGVLFLDEPTSGVDPLVRREFWRRINGMASAGVTVMVTTHFMEEAEYCDRIGIIYRGKLVETGSPEELKAAHKTQEHPDPTLEDAFIDLIRQIDDGEKK
jgi:ABC-2 type transport system ATP-binding protein